MDRQRMHAGCEFHRQRGINCAVPIDAALAAEDFRHDMHPIVRLPSGAMPRMARVQV